MTEQHRAALGNFHFLEIAKSSPQRLTVEVTAYAAARVQAFIRGVSNKDGFREIYKQTRERFEQYSVSSSHIKRRQLVFFPTIEDIRFENGAFEIVEPEREHLQLFKNRSEPRGADIRARHESYDILAEEVFEQFYRESECPPDDLIHVTCSGYLAPSPGQKLLAKKSWLRTRATHCYHMGCHGAFPAIRMAQGFIASSLLEAKSRARRVDIVHTEIPSLHRHFVDLTPQDILVMSLFADGFIKYGVYSDKLLLERNLRGLRILASAEQLLPDSMNAETWIPGPYHFEMTMTITVPVAIKKNLCSFVQQLLQTANLDFETEKKRLVFAIHPGGPQMVEHMREELGLRMDQIALSTKVFQERGNMSSATVPFILKEIIEAEEIELGSRVVAIGFGPGLTIAGLLLEKI